MNHELTQKYYRRGRCPWDSLRRERGVKIQINIKYQVLNFTYFYISILMPNAVKLSK